MEINLFMQASFCLPIQESTQIGEARRSVGAWALEAGFSETVCGQIAIVVTELASNLIKHTASGGQLIIRTLQNNTATGLEILALDRGPGMYDVSHCMKDGYSTAGSPGTGLGAIQRLSTTFDIYTSPGLGTVILAQFWTKSLEAERTLESKYDLEFGVIAIPYPGEDLCGDSWAVVQNDAQPGFMVADGLGHGLLAAEASREATRVFQDKADLVPTDLLKATHLALKSTRGAAVAIAKLDSGNRTIHYSGVGNISGVIQTVGEPQRRMVSHNGTAGLQTPRIQEFTYPWQENSLLIMHSDGLSTHWDLANYPGLQSRHPSVIAGILYRDFKRGNDDATVLVAHKMERR